MNLFFYDELERIYSQLEKSKVAKNSILNQDINIICDTNLLSKYVAGFFAFCKIKAGDTTKINIFTDEPNVDTSYKELNENFKNVTYKSFDALKNEKATFFFADLSSERYQKEQECKQLKSNLELALNQSENLICCFNFSFNRSLENSVTALAENELNESVAEKNGSFQLKFLLELESICKNHCVLRFNNIFAPCLDTQNNLGVDEIIRVLKENNAIDFKKSDSLKKFSATFISDAVLALCLVLAKGERQIFNVSSFCLSKFDVKSILLEKFIQSNPKVKYIDDVTDENLQVGYEALSPKLLMSKGFKSFTDTKEAIYKTACEKIDKTYVGEFYQSVYDGKLPRIKELELKLLKEVDRICKENDITYFLVGGTLLGSVRHGGFIPWDDDIDIGMLREDYDKFRKICSKNLNESMSFQYYKEDKNAHFIFEKIRLNATHFNSASSLTFPELNNGIFIDILVYDKTSNSPKLQKYHIQKVRAIKLLLNIKWLGKTREQNHKTLSKVLLPILNVLPFSAYHKWLDRTLSKYKNSKKSEYLIDGVGLNIGKGAFPLKWFEEYVDVTFEGMTFKITKYYDEYLKFLYGENYMQLLPESKRFSGHAIVRLDLGEYLYKD